LDGAVSQLTGARSGMVFATEGDIDESWFTFEMCVKTAMAVATHFANPGHHEVTKIMSTEVFVEACICTATYLHKFSNA